MHAHVRMHTTRNSIFAECMRAHSRVAICMHAYTRELLTHCGIFDARNFILAIIVEGYQSQRKKNEESEIEQNVFIDTYITFMQMCFSMHHRWPSRRKLHAIVSSATTEHLNVQTLLHHSGTKLTPKMAETLIAHYSSLEGVGRGLSQAHSEKDAKTADIVTMAGLEAAISRHTCVHMHACSYAHMHACRH